MRIDKLTTQFQMALGTAQTLAVQGKHAYLEPAHVVMALLDDTDSGASSLLARAGAAVPRLKNELTNYLAALPQEEGGESNLRTSRELQNALTEADKDATQRGDTYVASELYL